MSLTLDSTLQARMDTLNRRPIVEIMSLAAQDVIPFFHTYFNTQQSISERDSAIVAHSSGRMIMYYNYGDAIYSYYTDTDQMQWFQKANAVSGMGYREVDACEMDDGNIALITWGWGHIYSHKRSVTGTNLGDWAVSAYTGTWQQGASIIQLANGTYVAAWAGSTDLVPDGNIDFLGDISDTSKSYYLYYSTCTSFGSWSAKTEIPLTGLNVNHAKSCTELVQSEEGDLYLFFQYLDSNIDSGAIYNIYYVVSQDNGVTWSDPVKITDYDEPGEIAQRPAATMKPDGNMLLAYTKVAAVKSLDSIQATYIHLREELSQVYFACGGSYPTIIKEYTITDGFSLTREYNTTGSSPAICSSYTWFRDCNKGKFIILGAVAGISICFQILDVEAESITTYHQQYDADVRCGLSWNVDTEEPVLPWKQHAIRISDSPSYDRVYCHGGWGQGNQEIGFINLRDEPDPITGHYEYHTVIRWNWGTTTGGPHTMKLVHELGWAILGSNEYWGPHNDFEGIQVINIDAATPYVVYDIRNRNNAGMHRNGVNDFCYSDNKIYFCFGYTASYGMQDRRGLGCIDLSDMSVRYYRPSYATADEYNITCLSTMEDGRIGMKSWVTVGNGGLCVFDPFDESWTVYNDQNTPGLIFGGIAAGLGAEILKDWDYDSATGTFYATYWGVGGSGFVEWKETGSFETLYYIDVTDLDTNPLVPVFGDSYKFSFYDSEDNCAIVYDANGYLWAVWIHTDSLTAYPYTRDSIVWANTLSDKDLSDYLIDGSNVKITWDVEKAAKLEFELSHGHLFDPLNQSSIWSLYLKKGRKITVRIGENISDVEYWQNQGVFYAQEVFMGFKVDQYPKISVKAEDQRIFWEDHSIIASQYYGGNYPEDVIEDLLVEHGNLSLSDISISNFDNRHEIYHQFIETELDEAVREILDHFFYFLYMDVDGRVTCKKVDINQAVDHTYSDLAWMLEYTPDYSYSTFINRIIVKGMSNDFNEVLYNEETVGSVSGTTGWWGKDVDEKVWYSRNHEKTCRFPRLEVLQSVTEFSIFGIKGGGGESITDWDTDEKYCIVTIESPNLVGVFIATLGSLVAVGSMAITCDGALQSHCGPYIYAATVLANVAMYILGAVASYNYVVWAKPIGHEKQTFEAQADDEEFRALIGGRVVLEEIEDAFCYTIQNCQETADGEMEIVSAQRNRLKIKKIGHLQDEIGDMITVYHPYSNEQIDIFITSLSRTVQIGHAMVDEIEGWRTLPL